MAPVGLSLLAWVVLGYLALPLVIIVGASLTTTDFLVFPPQGLTLRWYGAVLQDSTYLSAFGVSTILALSATVAAGLLAIPACLAIARYRFNGRSAAEALFMSPLVLPHLVLGAAFLQYGSAIGLVRSFPALMVGHVVVIVPFVMRSVLPQLSDEQRALEDASMDLGASRATTFFLVTLPQIRGGVVSGAVLAFISSWINVELSIFNVTTDLMTIPVKLFNYVQYTIDPTIAAVSSITIIAAAALIVSLDIIFGLDVLPGQK